MRRVLTPARWIKLLGRMLGGTLMIAAASTAAAQDNSSGNYLGPGVLSRGAGDIGTRSGEQVDLRYFVGVTGIVSTNLQPFALDAQGNLLRIHNLYGVQLTGGAYGTHHWKRTQLGLDYGGNYQRYINSNSYNGSDQHLSLGLTVQPSRRWSMDLRETAGTVSTITSELLNMLPNDTNSVLTRSTLLFDSRTTFAESSAYATYLQSARTSFTFGGSASLYDQKASGLSNSWGYTFTGSGQRRITKVSTLGVSYIHSHYEFPGFHSDSDSNSYHGTFSTAVGQRWTFSLEAGVTVSEVSNQRTFVLPPTLAALFGVPVITENAYLRTTYPSGMVSLQRKFRRASLAFNYSRGAAAGNGVSGSARQELTGMSFSYTGIRKVSIAVNGGYSKLVSLGSNTGTYASFAGSAGFNYTLGRGISVAGSYEVNNQQIDFGNYNRTTTRATLGLMFSPGTLPLALW